MSDSHAAWHCKGWRWEKSQSMDVKKEVKRRDEETQRQLHVICFALGLSFRFILTIASDVKEPAFSCSTMDL